MKAPEARWQAAARTAQDLPVTCGLAVLSVLNLAGFRFKGPRGIPTPVFLAIVVVIIVLIVVAIWRASRRRNRSAHGGRG
jgi:hypothetical protein